MPWATWRNACILIAAVLVLRLVYLAWLSPWQLVGDEAYYWLQARHLSLGYNEKGPLLAWMIAACTAIFGNTEWAVRLPVALSSAIAAYAIGRLAMAISRNDQRVGFFAVAFFLLLPAFQANAQICTQDGPLIPLWVGLSAIALAIFRRWHAAGACNGLWAWGWWIAFYALLGVGFLLKQSVLMFLPGLLIYWVIFRRELRLTPAFFAQQAVGGLIFLAFISPIIIWDAQHGWPMLNHTIGHLGLGGDRPGLVDKKGNPLLWVGNTVGSFAGAFGPPALVLMIGSWVWACKVRASDPVAYRERVWMLVCAWFAFAFFVLLSFRKPIVPSWPLPTMITAVALVAVFTVDGLDRLSRDATDKHARRMRSAWCWAIGYGAVAQLALAFPTVARFTPKFGPTIEEKVLAQLTANRAQAERIQKVLDTLPPSPDGRPPLIVADHYHPASLASFYLKGHPDATTSGWYTWRRPSNFDNWPSTDLSNPAHLGRTLVLIDQPRQGWANVVRADQFLPTEDPGLSIAIGYRGLQPGFAPPPGRQ